MKKEEKWTWGDVIMVSVVMLLATIGAVTAVIKVGDFMERGWEREERLKGLERDMTRERAEQDMLVNWLCEADWEIKALRGEVSKEIREKGVKNCYEPKVFHIKI
jgi:hypothetical protein